ncbi:MAG: lytic transglycosylase domain-containing protein [Chitinophagales bacterium]
MKRIYFILIAAFTGIAFLVTMAVTGNTRADGANANTIINSDSLRTLADDVNTIKYFAAKIPATISFAGEAVPLNDFEVHERMDRELTINGYWHSNTIQNLKLAHRWFPEIEEILREENVPDDFKYLAMAESGLRNVVSPGNAHGVWQFLSETGTHYGLRINSEVDERYNVQEATRAACKYLKDAYAKFGNWTLAAASYNAGMGAIESAVKYQEENSYYDLYLKDETSRYIFRALAFKIIYEHSEQYGFFLSPDDLYNPLETKSVQVETSIPDLAAFARNYNTTYKMLKYYNPWLRSTTLTIHKGERYTLELPVDAQLKQEGDSK